MKRLFTLAALLTLTACGGGGNPSIPQLRPVTGGVITSSFGEREDHPVLGYVPGRHHDGYDFAVASGEPIRATIEGEVESAGWQGGYGNAVVLRHADGYSTLYGHASELLVQPGQRVQAGETIARVGSTGLSTGPHLHYELRKDGMAIDPGGFEGFAARPPRGGGAGAPLSAPAPLPPEPLTVELLRADRPASENGLVSKRS